MKVAFVIGNGVSRREIDLSCIKKHGTVYGCNALYREFEPDVLVATDTFISQTIQDSGYAKNHVFYTRFPRPQSGARVLPSESRRSASGPNALYLSIDDGHDLIYLVGFDMGPTVSNTLNNIYAGTEHYLPPSADPVCPDKWIADCVLMISKNPLTQFVRVVGPDSASIPALSSLKNFRSITTNEFISNFK